MRKIWIGGTGGIAAAAATIVLVMWLSPAKTAVGPSTAEALATVMRNFESVDALQCETDWLVEGDSQPTGGWRGTIVRDRGFRAESGDGHIEIYNHQEQKRYNISPDGLEVRRLHISDAGMLGELLRRARLEDNFEYFTIRSREPQAVNEIQLERSGRMVTRLETLDVNRRSIAVEFETATRRLLLSESWIPQQDPQIWVRSRSRFSYPSAGEISPTAFDPPALEGKRVIEERESDMQCMVNLRNLGMAIQLYASEHEDRLPTRLEDLAPYAPNANLNACRTCSDASGAATAIELRSPAEIGVNTLSAVAEPGQTVILRCRMNGFDFLGYADSHTEKKPIP